MGRTGDPGTLEAWGASPQSSKNFMWHSGWCDVQEAKVLRNFCGNLAGAAPQALPRKSLMFLSIFNRFDSIFHPKHESNFKKHH